MLQKKRLAIALDTTLGWRSVYNNWRDLYPIDYAFEPHWIDLMQMSSKANVSVKKTRLRQVVGRFQMTRDINQAMRNAKADAALIGNMALNLLGQSNELPVFTMIDATQQQLHGFGDAYGIYPSRLKFLETLKHRVRCRAYQRCAGIFAFSQWAANSLVQNYGVDATKVHVVPPGADMRRWQQPSRAMRAGKPCNVLFVGGDFQRKGGAILLDWAMRTKQKDWKLHIVTKHPVATTHPSISIYNGITQDDARLPQLFALADIFVLPTLFDCSSIAIQEALAAGLPIVTSDVGGIPELVLEGISGYVVSVREPSRFSEKLDLLIDDPLLRVHMSEAAAEDAKLRFDAKANMQSALEIIAELA